MPDQFTRSFNYRRRAVRVDICPIWRQNQEKVWFIREFVITEYDVWDNVVKQYDLTPEEFDAEFEPNEE